MDDVRKTYPINVGGESDRLRKTSEFHHAYAVQGRIVVRQHVWRSMGILKPPNTVTP